MLTRLALENRVLTVTLVLLALVAGFQAFNALPRLEDPEFTIKSALVTTPYPGATSTEVEEEVSDVLERAVRQLGRIKYIESRNLEGLSTITVEMLPTVPGTELPQVWDELRRKVGDVQGQLPPGAGPSIVNDDYGDVYGIFFAVYGEEYTAKELHDYVKVLERELVLIDDVGKVTLFGVQPEVVYIDFDRARMAELGVTKSSIAQKLQTENVVLDAGTVEVGPERIRVSTTGLVTSVADLGKTLVTSGRGDGQVRLEDIAAITRGYQEPARSRMRYARCTADAFGTEHCGGTEAIGVGVSLAPGGNVVEVGAAVERRLSELDDERPLGVELGVVSFQSRDVTNAIDGFLINLIEAVVIVVLVLLVFMGLRSGLIIGFVLVLTIAGTFIFLAPAGVALERISLGALVIALGMLVDNAIVVVDGVLVRLDRMGAEAASKEVAAQTSMPLLGATIIAILAFAAIGTSSDSTGEFCRSLFVVVLISLFLSWITGMTVTPLLCVWFLPRKEPSGDDDAAKPEGDDAAYDNAFYRGYKTLLAGAIRYRAATILVVLVVFGASVFAFGSVKQSFFPPATRNQFQVDVFLPQGTDIDATTERVARMESYLLGLDGVVNVASTIGAGPLRFILTFTPEKPNPSYALFLIEVDDPSLVGGLIEEIETKLDEVAPEAVAFGRSFSLGPSTGGKISARLMGDDPDALRLLETEVVDVMKRDPELKGVRVDWGNRVKAARPTIDNAQADALGVTRSDVAAVIREGFEGLPVGVYRERDELLPVVFRAANGTLNIDSLRALQVWSPVAGRRVPLGQVVSGVETRFTDQIVGRRNRRRTLKVEADPVGTVPATVPFNRIQPRVDALEMPPGTSIEWGGEYESSRDAQAALAGSIPAFVVLMMLIVIALFNAVRQPLIIFLTVPLAVIGVTWGLLGTGQPFGFMALLGFLSLSGMLIKNAIVLIDEIEIQKRAGLAPYDAVMSSGVSRLRPVAMAALTTVLGMIPLFTDGFFVSMAVTIVFGLLVATLLTMVFVPVLYATFFRLPSPQADA